MTTPPTIVGASAGSGKTYRLTQEVTGALAPGAMMPARVDGLVAVTYTRKAQAELASRIRRTLVEHGAFEEAARLPVAYLGTVHAVCMRLLEDFALDAGLSPYPDVMPDDSGRRMHAAIEATLSPPMIADLSRLARRLGVLHDARTDRNDWIRRVAEIMELARSNRIAPDRLLAMGARSADGLMALLPAAGDGAALRAGFAAALDLAIVQLDESEDGTKKTATALGELREIRQRVTSGLVRWSDWPRAAHIEPSVDCADAIAPLVAAASQFERHPDLHDDLRAFTAGVFEAAGLALAGYAAWKARRRLVDYADMIEQALRLAEDPAVAAELADRLDLVVVDEFQDTSPLQLALFARLHHCAGRSVWVGDGKQCIFEYAGADPLLMDAVSAWVARAGGTSEQLERNFRSRPELVDACAALFVPAFAAHGWAASAVRTTAARTTPAALASTPPLAVWWLDGKSAEQDAGGVAGGVERLLADACRTAVLDRETGTVRPVAARDIGILTATNAEAKRIAGLLAQRGVKATLPRDGLMQTPEGVLVDAALRWVLEPGDRSSQATLEALAGWNGTGPDAWLAARLRAEETDPPAWLTPLAGLRQQLDVLAPTEALDRALALVDAATRCARWPDPAQRRGNLDALRALATRYEDRCLRLREPATVAGLVRYFGEARTVVRRGAEEQATDDQFSGATDDAVTVCTYHRAKGLEWPVVVLTSLDRHERRDAFEPCPESDRPGFDPQAPLVGRWVRFWPWPFGAQRRAPLALAAAASTEGRRVAEREQRERVRLLYVGFTRARDHLVLAARLTAKGPKTDWLDVLQDAAGAPLLTLPTKAADGALDRVRMGDHEVACRVWHPDRQTVADIAQPQPARLARPPHPVAERRGYRITPSRPGAAASRGYVVDRVVSISAGLRLGGRADWEAMGTAIHAFLAADPYAHGATMRAATADRILEGAGLTGVLDAATLLATADGLRRYQATRWPAATWEREVPVTAIVAGPDGPQRIAGVIDLLGRVDGGLILVDHKTYPAPSLALVAAKAADLTPQLAIYADALAACGHVVLSAHFHFPLAGAWVDLRPG